MGFYYALRLYKGTDTATLRKVMEETAQFFEGSIHWNPGRSASGDCDLRTSHNGETHTVYIPYQHQAETIYCHEIGGRLKLPWIELRIQDGAIWDYSLYKGDQNLDNFSVCPQYCDLGVDAQSLEAQRGNPQVLAEAWSIPVARIEKYMVNWGIKVDEDEGICDFQRTGKAYPTDKNEYGDEFQMFDFLEALGGIEPNEEHCIVLWQDKVKRIWSETRGKSRLREATQRE